MDKILLQQFILQLNKLEGKEYLLYTVAYGTAPTLKRVKPSSLMSFSSKGKNLCRLWEKYKFDISAALNLCFFELKKTQDRHVVLFYKDEMLKKHISTGKNRTFLREMGYDDPLRLEQSLQRLKTRFVHLCPHEIGVFLGIPVEDVAGFIAHRGEKCLFCRYWKVYHNPERAQRLFQCYDRAKNSVMDSVVHLPLVGNTTAEAY